MEISPKRNAIADIIVRALYSLYDPDALDHTVHQMLENQHLVADALAEDTRGDDEMLPTEVVARAFAKSDPYRDEEARRLAEVFPRTSAFMQDFCGAM